MNSPFRKGLVAVSALLALAALPALAGPGREGRGEGRGGGHGLGRLLPSAAYLDLTAEQKTAVEQLREDAKAKIKPMIEGQRAARQELSALLDAAQPDATAVGRLTIQMHQSRQAVQDVLKATEQSFVALLNADQKTKYENFRELRSERRERGDRGRHGKGGHGHDKDGDGEN